MQSGSSMYEFETKSRYTAPRTEDRNRLNMRGDVYAINSKGQVSSFRYADQDTSFSFSYDDRGNLQTISSSAGWTWSKTETNDFNGWVIRNYFDRWQVPTEDVGEVYVNHSGIHTTRNSASLMALPELSLS